jgi:predicted AlkP superfamily pyrophosphatase or phosphodiesterase
VSPPHDTFHTHKMAVATGPSARAVPVLLLLLFLHLVGVGLFTQGFFLTRLELQQTSTCADERGTILQRVVHPRKEGGRGDGASSSSSAPSAGSCWTAPLYERLVVVVIDAWRYDFAAWRGPLPPAPSPSPSSPTPTTASPPPSTTHLPPYLNRMPRLARRLASSPSHARLSPFAADPPTVTMQRLKGLTAGSLPTFLDLSNNFASDAIREDNWVTQAAAEVVTTVVEEEDGATGFVAGGPRRRLHFMGDDTWTGLFPDAFRLHPNSTSRPFPSFDVKDLHTVDNGVVRHLLPTLRGDRAGEEGGKEGDGGHLSGADRGWDVVIAHFLGVDHAGHRHGPSHPDMAAKLDQMDSVLDGVVAELEAQSRGGGGGEGEGGHPSPATLLVVLGDHGMTRDGNHGGATSDETQAALYVHSFGRPLVHAGASSSGGAGSSSRVLQVDLVPSLALALGLPIPYASLGAVIPDWDWGQVSSPPPPAAVGGNWSEGAGARLASAHARTRAYALNAFQVQRYLRAYAAAAQSFNPAEVSGLLRAYDAAVAKLEELMRRTVGLLRTEDGRPRSGRAAGLGLRGGDGARRSGGGGSPSSPADLAADAEAAIARLIDKDDETPEPAELESLLEAHAALQADLRGIVEQTADMCRTLWTQFDTRAMLWGIIVLALATGVSLHVSLGRVGLGDAEELDGAVLGRAVVVPLGTGAGVDGQAGKGSDGLRHRGVRTGSGGDDDGGIALPSLGLTLRLSAAAASAATRTAAPSQGRTTPSPSVAIVAGAGAGLGAAFALTPCLSTLSALQTLTLAAEGLVAIAPDLIAGTARALLSSLLRATVTTVSGCPATYTPLLAPLLPFLTGAATEPGLGGSGGALPSWAVLPLPAATAVGAVIGYGVWATFLATADRASSSIGPRGAQAPAGLKRILSRSPCCCKTAGCCGPRRRGAPSFPGGSWRPRATSLLMILGPLVLRFWGLFTNSFIVAEGRLAAFLLGTGAVIVAARAASNGLALSRGEEGIIAASASRDTGRRVPLLAAALLVLALVCGRVEEHGGSGLLDVLYRAHRAAGVDGFVVAATGGVFGGAIEGAASLESAVQGGALPVEAASPADFLAVLAVPAAVLGPWVLAFTTRQIARRVAGAFGGAAGEATIAASSSSFSSSSSPVLADVVRISCVSGALTSAYWWMQSLGWLESSSWDYADVLRLGIPRVVYTLTAVSVAFLARAWASSGSKGGEEDAAAALSVLVASLRLSASGTTGGAEGPSRSVAHAALRARTAAAHFAEVSVWCWGGFASALLPSLGLVLGPWAPSILLSLSLHFVALGGLVMLLNGSEALSCALLDDDEADASPTPGPSSSSWALLSGGEVVPSDDDGGYPPSPPSSHRTLCASCCDFWGARFLRTLATSIAHFPAALLLLGSLHAFHATGHAPQFSALAYASAFVGADSFSLPVAGALLLLNTFGASHVLGVVLFAPVLAAASAAAVPGAEVPRPRPSHAGASPPPFLSSAWASALSGRRRTQAHAASNFRALAILLTPATVGALCTCIFCFITRRELMVWAIFAPKFCFEAVGVWVTCLALLLAARLAVGVAVGKRAAAVS